VVHVVATVIVNARGKYSFYWDFKVNSIPTIPSHFRPHSVPEKCVCVCVLAYDRRNVRQHTLHRSRGMALLASILCLNGNGRETIVYWTLDS
jgi:hypothetical protein